MQSSADCFEESFSKGQKGELELDVFFRNFFYIIPATREQEKAGIDRLFLSLFGNKITIQYKTSYRQTRCAWLEVVAVRRAGKTVPGWVATTQAYYVVFYEVLYKTLYIVRSSLLREKIKEWSDKYPTVERGSYNVRSSWNSEGIAVPFTEVAAIGVTILLGNYLEPQEVFSCLSIYNQPVIQTD